MLYNLILKLAPKCIFGDKIFMTKKRRVVITGMGIISPLGNNIESNWSSIKNSTSGINKITKFNTDSFATKIAGEVKDFNIQEIIETSPLKEKELRRMDQFMQYGMAAGIQAINDSKLEEYAGLDKQRVGLIIGSGIGGLPYIEQSCKIVSEKGPRSINPFFIPGSISNMISGNLSILYGYKGVNYAAVSACATSNHCIGDAMRYIEYGDCDVIIAGGAESAISELGIGGFNAARALSVNNDNPEQASCPWDIKRNGFVMGEGAGILVLEEYEHAKARKAKIYAEIVGYAATADAYHITAPLEDGSGAAACMEIALRNANIEAAQVDYINAHGTSTVLGDLAETKAIKKCFGDHAYKLSISSTKSLTGHLLGAAGGIEAIYTILAIQHNLIPPTINLNEAGEDCDLDYTPNKPVAKTVNVALSNSFGFGGTNSCLVFKKYKEV